MITNKKGQMTIIGIIMGVMAVITFALILPILNTAIEIGENNTDSSVLSAIFNMYPLFIGLGILIMIITYMTIVRPE